MNRKTILSMPVACFWFLAGSWRYIIPTAVFVLIYGYNRIHMTNHFLSDVCFGTMITYLIYALISTAFGLRDGEPREIKLQMEELRKEMK